MLEIDSPQEKKVREHIYEVSKYGQGSILTCSCGYEKNLITYASSMEAKRIFERHIFLTVLAKLDILVTQL